VAESIFTSQTPGAPNESDGPYTLGTVFSASVPGRITAIRWYFPSTLPGGTVQGLLYRESTGALLDSVNFSGSPAAGTWNVATFASPIDIDAATNYVAAVLTPDRYVATVGLFNGTAISNGHLTAPADDAGLRNGRFNSGGTATYPTGSFGGNGYFVDVVFETGIEVATGQASTSDTAGAVTAAKTRTVGLAAVVDTATAVTGNKTRAVGLAAVTDTANPIGRVKTSAVGLAAETVSAAPVSAAKAHALTAAVEANTANPVTRVKTVTVGQASGTATAQSISRVKTRAVGMASETSTARPLAQAITVQLGLATETTTALPITAQGGAVPQPARGRVRLRSYSAGVTLR
jgi:hypothetical protein